MIEHDPQVRQFLEQMMIRFTALGLPVERGARELVEIEAHIYQSGQDPFEAFGDPQKLATALIPLQERQELYQRGLRDDLFIGVLIAFSTAAAVQFVLSFFGNAITSVPKLVIVFVLFGFWGAGQLAFVRIMTGVADDDQSLRMRGAAMVCFAAFVGALVFSGALALAGADLTGSRPLELNGVVWLGAALVIAAGVVVFAYRAWKLKRPSDALVEGGVTGQIIFEMNHNGFMEGWVRYGPNGEDLRDPDYSILKALRSGQSDE